MNKKALTIISVSLLSANVAIAATTAPVSLAVAQLPLEEGGIFAIAAACLVAGFRIIQRKRNH